MIYRNNLNHIWSELIIEELIRNGIDLFCISPGSRSTPLTAAAAYNKKAKKIISYDERGSGFYALGFGQASQKPAAIIVTSGTAVANLYPSVIEAFQSKIPMIILTADRPPELQKAGANQTINQENIFGNYTRWFFNMPCPDYNINPSFVLSNIDNAIRLSMSEPKGPVHLNFMFREPLEPFDSEDNVLDKNYLSEIEQWTNKTGSYWNFVRTLKNCDKYPYEKILELISINKKGLISIGRLSSDDERKYILKLLNILKWPVYADIISGLRFKKSAGTNIIKHFDMNILSSVFCENAKPEVVLHFGERITSKRFFEFLKAYRPEIFINVKNDNVRYNPEHLALTTIEADICNFCDCLTNMIKKIKQKEDFRSFYDKKACQAQKIIDRNIKEEKALNEVFIARYISKNLSEEFCLFLSNSMPVRDFELYSDCKDLNIKVGSNRGASGIDGVIASAAGFATGNKKAGILVTGDIAFIHDINSLSLLGRSDFPLIVVLINNNGGGIFNFLPISGFKEIFDEYFVTPHGYQFAGAAENFKIKHNSAYNKNDFKDLFEDAKLSAKNKKESSIIEAHTNGEYDFKFRKKIKYEIIEMLEDKSIIF